MRNIKKSVLLALVFLSSFCMNPLFSMGNPPESEESEDNFENAGVSRQAEAKGSDFYNESERGSQRENVEFNRYLQELWSAEENQEAQNELFLDALTELEPIFQKKDEKEFSKILKKYSKQMVYPLVEDYSKKQINRLIIENEMGFVLAALYTLIDTNIDVSFEDEEAIEMYYTIYESYALQKRAKVEQ